MNQRKSNALTVMEQAKEVMKNVKNAMVLEKSIYYLTKITNTLNLVSLMQYY